MQVKDTLWWLGKERGVDEKVLESILYCITLSVF